MQLLIELEVIGYLSNVYGMAERVLRLMYGIVRGRDSLEYGVFDAS